MDETTQGSDERLVENIKILRDRMPADKDINADIERVEGALKTRRTLISDLHGYLYYNTSVDEPRIFELSGKLSGQKVKMNFMKTDDLVEVPLAVGLLKNEVFTRAERDSKIAESESQFWRGASILLYIAGFVLGLGGKFFGVDMPSAGA
jgi:hypothetical protein